MKVSSFVISSLVTGSSSEFYQEDYEAASQLVDTLQFLSPMSSAFKFDNYGCHCFQKGLDSSEFSGKGPALDDMDRACLRFHQCQRCLGIDGGQECNHRAKYDIQLIEDPVTSVRSAVCSNKPGSCQRNLCECTVAFANAMRGAEETSPWDIAISKYSSDQSFRAQCHGHGATGLVHGQPSIAAAPTVTTTTATTTTTEEEVATVPVRARFIDMPEVNLKLAGNDRDVKSSVGSNRQNTYNKSMDDFWKNGLTDGQAAMEAPTVLDTTTEITTQMGKMVKDFVFEEPAATTSEEVIATSGSSRFIPVTAAAPVEPPREVCCGSYADHRFPYYNLNRGCCGGKTFDTINLKCCDGVIKSINTRC